MNETDKRPGRILDEDVLRVRTESKIEEVVADHVTLKNGGSGSFVGLCPFHDEGSPSFRVNPAKGFYHCLAGETRVITRDGVFPISELAGKTVKVLTSSATWVDSPFLSFGVQSLFRITLSRNSKKKEIYATDEHRWFLRKDSIHSKTHWEVFTKNLKSGDALQYAFSGDAIGLDRTSWIVDSVEATDRVEEVYCAVVPEYKNFVLEDNILTGNCFGCSESGDVISFVQQIEHLSFVEAVEKLADRFEIELHYSDGVRPQGLTSSERMRLIEMNRHAALFYKEQLDTEEAKEGLTYILGRGFTREEVDSFEIGYSPTAWDGLSKFLKAKGFNDKELVSVGLAMNRESGQGVYDFFRGRLMWPIRDLSGEVVGFGARKISADDRGPKYLNTPETPLYKKSEILYGLHSARKSIAQNKEVVIVEGYTDVMACHVSGVTNVVAACGTAFGEGHVKIIRRLLHDNDMYSGKVIYTFDGDAAGQNAAMKAFKDNNKFTTATYVSVAPDGMDPCEVMVKEGEEGVKALIARAIPLAEFVLNTNMASFDLDTAEGRTNALKVAAPILLTIKDLPLRGQYITKVGGWLGMDERTVRSAVSSAQRSEGNEQAVVKPTLVKDESHPDPKDPTLAVERDVLKCLLQSPEETQDWYSGIDPTAFTNTGYIGLFRTLLLVKGDLELLLQDYNHTAISNLATELIVEPINVNILTPEYLSDTLFRLLDKDVARKIAGVKARMSRLDASDAAHAEAFKEVMALENKRKEYKKNKKV
jgi:DNA primase